MRLVILDPFLKNQSGHNFFYTRALRSELAKRGIPVIVFGGKDTSLATKDFYPCLTSATDKVLNASLPITALFSLFRRIAILKNDFAACLLRNPGFEIQEGDIFLAHAFYIFELLALAWFIHAHHQAFIKRHCTIRIGLNFRYIRGSSFLTFFFAAIYKFACNVLLEKAGDRVVYHSDCQLLIPEYEKLLRLKISFSSMPVYPFGVEAPGSRQTVKPAQYQGRITVAYLGGARYNKGFDILARLVERLVAEPGILERIFLIVQVDIHAKQQPKSDTRAVFRAAEILEQASKKIGNSRILRGSLTMEDYYRLLLESDIVVLPYRDETYRVVTSNIFVEVITAGKIPIVSGNTWMSHELSRFGLQGLIFDLNADSMTEVLSSVLNNLQEYRQRIRPIQKDFQELYSSKKMADMLMS